MINAHAVETAHEILTAIAKCERDQSPFEDAAIDAALPDRLSDLLRLAVRDAQAAEAMPGVELDMETYWAAAWDPGDTGETAQPCLVCMAGSMLIPLGAVLTCDGYSSTPKLRAVDALRRGSVFQARAELDLPCDEDAPELPTDWCLLYESTTETRLTWDQYLTMADELEAAGL